MSDNMFRTVEVWVRSRAQVDENLHMNCLMLGEVRDVERLTNANWGRLVLVRRVATHSVQIVARYQGAG